MSAPGSLRGRLRSPQTPWLLRTASARLSILLLVRTLPAVCICPALSATSLNVPSASALVLTLYTLVYPLLQVAMIRVGPLVGKGNPSELTFIKVTSRSLAPLVLKPKTKVRLLIAGYWQRDIWLVDRVNYPTNGALSLLRPTPISRPSLRIRSTRLSSTTSRTWWWSLLILASNLLTCLRQGSSTLCINNLTTRCTRHS